MRTFIVATIIMITASAFPFAGWLEDIDSLLRTDTVEAQEELLDTLGAYALDHYDVMEAINAYEFPEAEGKGEFHLRTALCIDNIERPWVLYIPESYDPAIPSPLMVVLHGGVSRAGIFEDPMGYAGESNFSRLGVENGWLMIYPFGQSGATWWDEVGMGNIDARVREVKREFNVDDDRVYMAGFSDGASACMLYAMAVPNDYAAFIGLNGHIGVGSLDGGIQTYPRNMANSYLYTTTTDNDVLYPTHKMSATIEMAIEAGANVEYRKLEGEHRFDFADTELPLIVEYLRAHPRDPNPARVVCEAADPAFGQMRWLVIDEVANGEQGHDDFNYKLLNDRVTFGFVYDEGYAGEGVLIDTVIEESPAEEAGLSPGDVLIRGNDAEILSADDIYLWKEDMALGDEFEMTVLRDGVELTLKGRIPEPEEYDVFTYETPSALAEAVIDGNAVEVTASGVKAFRILVLPGMFDLDAPVIIRVNGETIYEDYRVEVDIDYMLRNFLENRDRKAAYIEEIKVEF